MYKLATLHHTVSGEHSIIFSVPEIATEERGRSTIARWLKGAVIRHIGHVIIYICTPIYKYCVKHHALLPLNGLEHRTFKIKRCSISKCSLVADKRLRSGLKAQQAHSPGQPTKERAYSGACYSYTERGGGRRSHRPGLVNRRKVRPARAKAWTQRAKCSDKENLSMPGSFLMLLAWNHAFFCCYFVDFTVKTRGSYTLKGYPTPHPTPYPTPEIISNNNTFPLVV